MALMIAWQNGVSWAVWPLVAILGAVGIFTAIHIFHPEPRPKPDNYIGKFRQPDGTIVHVARMGSGRLWAASDAQPPVEIGYVEGRDVTHWQKLAVTPDG